jgi:hypothetical protein
MNRRAWLTYIVQEVHQAAEREDKEVKLLYQLPLSLRATPGTQILSEFRDTCHVDFDIQEMVDD